MRIGIDFGTTRTVVASADGGRYPVAAFEGAEGFHSWVPTMAALDEGRWVYGERAAELLQRGGPGVRSIKRALGALAPEQPVPGFDVTALELATGFLAELREALVERSNLELAAGEPLEAMIAVPANSSSRQRFLTLEAARRAGFEVVGMINEPSAAAVEFAFRSALSPRSPKRYVVVYDLGGGTFDTSAVSLDGRRFDLLASEGIARLGGDDVDSILLDAWEAERGEPVGEALRIAALEVCRRAKEGLTAQSRRLLLDPPAELGLEPCVLDVGAVYDACDALVEPTLALLDDVFAALPADLDPEDARQLGAVYLVGGGVAFPAVQRALRKRHGRKVMLAPESHAATAVGLAVAADPDAGVLVREATTRYFGVWREGEGGRETVFDPILRKDQMGAEGSPLVIQRAYHPAHSVGHLRFVECTRLDAEGRPSGDLAPFGELRFPYDPALRERGDLAAVPVQRRPDLGDQIIVERYSYTADGRIEVQIENRTHAYRRELVLR
ncbi:MAG: Hsp70 family protein [Sandaracinaceae bacterium]|nr:Hsp70 family protein [Sandaracinaceae bacterium]